MVTQRNQLAKKQIVVDTDWITFTASLLFLLFCILAAFSTIRRIVSATPASVSVTWQSWVWLMFGSWLTWAAKPRVLKFGVGLLVLGTASRVLLWLVHASPGVQQSNAMVMRCVDGVVLVACVLYGGRWLKDQVHYV